MTPGSIYTRLRDGFQHWTARWLDLGDSRWERELAEARTSAGAQPLHARSTPSAQPLHARNTTGAPPLRHAMAEWSASPASGREHEFRPAPVVPAGKVAGRPSALPGDDVSSARGTDAGPERRSSEDAGSADEAGAGAETRKGWWARMRERRMSKHPALHAYRRLVMRLHLELEGLERGRALMLTSPKATRECAQAARELARHLAEEQDQRVLLVDACVLHPALSAALEHGSSPGLTSLLDGREDALASLVVDTGQPGVCFLPAGDLERGNAGPMWPESIEKFVASATAEYDYLLLVCPPVLEDSTAMAFPAAVDFVLLVAVEGDTRKKDLDDAQHTLETCRAKRIGIVLSSATKRGLFGLWR